MISILQYEIDVNRANNIYVTESGMVDIYLEDASPSLGEKIKNAIKKIVALFTQFVKNLAHAISNVFTQVNLKVRLLHIKDTLTISPELKKMTVTCYYDPEFKKDYATYVTTMKNRLLLMKNRSENYDAYKLTSLMDAQRHHWYRKEQVRLDTAVQLIENDLKYLEEDLDNTVKDLINFTKLRDYSTEEETSCINRISNFLKDRNMVRCNNMVTNVNKLFSTVKSGLSSFFSKFSRYARVVTVSNDLKTQNLKSGIKKKTPAKTFTFDNEKFDIYVDNSSIHDAHNSFVASIFTFYKSGDHFIVVQKEFFTELSPKEQEAVLLHEIGHYKNGDTGIKTKTGSLSKDMKVAKKIDKSKSFKNLSSKIDECNYSEKNKTAIKNNVMLYLVHELDADKTALNLGAKNKDLDNGLRKGIDSFSDFDRNVQDIRKEVRPKI